MSLIPYAPGEFSIGDKLQPHEYIKSRTDVLKRLYGVDSNLARDVISMVYPHEAKRPWTDEEIRSRLELPTDVAQALQASPVIKAASEFLASNFPSLSSAFSAYEQERQRQAMIADMESRQRFPGLHATQPEMASMFQQQQQGFAPIVHHRRRHHAT